MMGRPAHDVDLTKLRKLIHAYLCELGQLEVGVFFRWLSGWWSGRGNAAAFSFVCMGICCAPSRAKQGVQCVKAFFRTRGNAAPERTGPTSRSWEDFLGHAAAGS